MRRWMKDTAMGNLNSAVIIVLLALLPDAAARAGDAHDPVL